MTAAAGGLTGRRRSFASILLGGGAWALGGKIVGAALGLVLTAILARQMAPPEFGVYLLASSIVATLATVARLGLDQVGLRLVAEHLGRNDEAAAAAIAWRVLAVVACASLVLGIVGGPVLGPWLARRAFGSEPLAGAMPAAALWLTCLAVQLTLAELFRACRDIRMASLLGGTVFGGVLSAVLIALGVAGAWGLGMRLDAQRALLVSAGGTAASAVLGLAVLVRSLPPARPDARHPGTASLVRLGLPLLAAQLGLLVMLQADVWILGMTRPEDEVALYGAASRVVKFLALLAVVNEVTAPEIVRLNVLGQRERLGRLLRVTAAIAALPCLAGVAVLAAAPGDVLELLYGPFYRGGGAVLLILAAGTAVAAFAGPAPYALMLLGRGTARMAVSLGGAATMLAAGATLTPSHGMVGLAASVAGAVALQQVAAWLCVRRACGVWTHADPIEAARLLRQLLARRVGSSHAA